MTAAVARGLTLLCCACFAQSCGAKEAVGVDADRDCEQLCEFRVKCEFIDYADALDCHNDCVSMTGGGCDTALYDFSICARDASCESASCAVEEGVLVDCWKTACPECYRNLCNDIPTCGAPGEGEGEIPDGYCEEGTPEYQVAKCAIDNEESFCNGTSTDFTVCLAG